MITQASEAELETIDGGGLAGLIYSAMKSVSEYLDLGGDLYLIATFGQSSGPG